MWDEVIARTGADSRLSVGFQAFLTIACLLAAIGAIENSPVTVVGAMVLGPEFAPLAALAVGAVLRRGDLLRRGALALGVGFPFAMLVTAGATLVFEATGLLTVESLDRTDQVDFIFTVGPFSLIVALLGVFISVTTVPAAAFAAVAFVEGRYAQALGSAAQLAVNLVGIVLAAAVVLVISRQARRRRGSGRRLSAG